MSDKTNDAFQFFPRPEAHSMRWNELLPPAQRAVRGLLWRIKGSIEKVDSKLQKKKDDEAGAEIASCFLVHGDRGTGKTTVLLCAKYACESNDEFFAKTRHQNPADAELRAQAIKSAESLKDVVWLDILDLEPLPPNANLLTTFLTRVRGALDRPGSNKDFRGETRSIVEEGAGSARHDLNQLINDATLMWEDIYEQDTRSRATRQVAAAGIYAEFRQRFLRAMSKLSGELARQRSSSERGCPIVLPIDNIDRSTDHLRRIVKLAQMVSCPHLWLVMAGDRQDVETFLERAYWKELIQIGENAGATAKQDARGEDEALVMARRQAAAALHKLLPPSHRVEVALVSPEDTLKFSPRDGESSEDKSTASLLKEVLLTNENDQARLALIDLFDAGNLLAKAHGESSTAGAPERSLTSAGQLALFLPARGVLDLWQITHWIASDPVLDNKQKATLIARIMLRNVIAESTMPNWAGRYIQEEMIKSGTKNGKRGTILDVGNRSAPLNNLPWLEGSWLCSEEFYFVLPANQKSKSAYDVRSCLGVLKGEALRLRLCKKRDYMPLPDPVAGWLAVLYDALTWEGNRLKESAIISRMPLQPPAQVSAWHWGVAVDGICAVDRAENKPPLVWPVPDWGSFIAHDLWGLLWRRFIDDIKKHKQLEDKEEPSWLEMASQKGCLANLLCAGWVGCALDTFSTLMPVGGEQAANEPRLVSKLISRGERAQIADCVKDAEVTVMKAAALCYDHIRKENSQGTLYRSDTGGAWPITSWLIQSLPLLLSHLYVPLPGNRADERGEGIIDVLKGTNLAKDWGDKAPFILAVIEAQLADRFPHACSPGANGQEKPREEILLATQKWKENLRPFFNLDRLWSREHQKNGGSTKKKEVRRLSPGLNSAKK